MSKTDINQPFNQNTNSSLTTSRFVPSFSPWVNIKLANGNYYNFLEILANPTAVIEILKNIDNVTIDRAYCTKYDLISSIIISWSRALNNNLPEYGEINSLMTNIINTPDLYQHLKDKAVLPISINLVSNPNNLASSNLLYNKMGEKIPDYYIGLKILKSLDPNILPDYDKDFIQNNLNSSYKHGSISFQDSFEDYTFANIALGIKYSENSNFILDTLKNISKLNVISSHLPNNKVDNDFIDLLIGYNEMFKYYNITQYNEFKDLLRNIAQDPVQQNYLKNFGATELDIALLSKNKQLIQEFAQNNSENSPQLFNNWRCIDLASCLHKNDDEDLYGSKFFNYLKEVNLIVPDTESIPLAFLSMWENLKYVNPDLNNHNTAILISNSGEFAWNGRNMNNDFEHIKTAFDHTYFYGNSINHLNIETISSCIKNIFAKKIYKKNHKNIYVEISLHGSEDGSNIINLVNSLPNKPKNVEVTYFIKACHSRYGIKDLRDADIIKKGNFIVAADYDENSKTSVDFDVAKFCKRIEKNSSSLEGYLDYFAQDFHGSKIFFSGKLQDGTILKNISIHEANTINHDVMISHNEHSAAEGEHHGVWCKFKKWLCIGKNNVDTNSDIEENVIITKENPISEDNNLYTITHENGNTIVNTIDNQHITFTSNFVPENISIKVNGQDVVVDLHGATDYTVSSDITG